jgi:hypothetical protein
MLSLIVRTYHGYENILRQLSLHSVAFLYRFSLLDCFWGSWHLCVLAVTIEWLKSYSILLVRIKDAYILP